MCNSNSREILAVRRGVNYRLINGQYWDLDKLIEFMGQKFAPGRKPDPESYWFINEKGFNEGDSYVEDDS